MSIQRWTPCFDDTNDGEVPSMDISKSGQYVLYAEHVAAVAEQQDIRREGFARGWIEGLSAAREAVAALEPVLDERSEWTWDALAAIDALRGEQNWLVDHATGRFDYLAVEPDDALRGESDG